MKANPKGASNHAEDSQQDGTTPLRSFFENMSAGYFFIDADGIIRDVNDAWVKLYKYDSREEIIGRHISVIQRHDDVAKANDYVRAIMRGDPRFLTGEFSRKGKNDLGLKTQPTTPCQSHHQSPGQSPQRVPQRLFPLRNILP